MKYYLADFAIRDGDNEYAFQFLVHAENLKMQKIKQLMGSA